MYTTPRGLGRTLSLFLGCCFLAVAASAQPLEFRKCAIMEFYPELLPENYTPDASTLKRDRALVNKQLQQFRQGPEEVYTIPVVIHIVHHVTDVSPGMGSNITDAQAASQIQVLNEDFRAILGTPGQSTYPDSIAADIRVEFVLATEDPDGNPTSGIIRHPRSDYTPGVGYDPALGFPGQFDLVVKPETIWDPDRYMNMWSADLGPVLLGYAQFPEGSGLAGMPSEPQDPNTDGVVQNYSAFGSSDIAPGGNYNPPYDKGRTATHEVGHFLGLRHIWGDGDCDVDDFVLDTPRSADSNGGCPVVNTCNDTEYGALVDFNDMVENYMDYTQDTCMNTFTEGQKARIRQVLEVSPRRASLVGNTPNQAGLTVAKSDGGAPVRDDETITYTLTVTNDSDDEATGVVLTDEVPAQTVYVSGSASDGGNESAGTVTWSLGTLGPGASATRTYQVTVDTGEGSEFLFQDGIESGGDNWTVGGILTTWTITSDDAHRGTSSWFAQDPDNESDQYLDLDASAPLPAGALFRFWHRFNTEASFDAGVVEVSTNGGLTWDDAGPYFTQNGYTSTIPLANNPHIGGREAFDGNSGGFLETIADLSSFEGESVSVRFRFASDVLTPQEGWYIDDVAFATNLVSVSGTATVTSNEGEIDSATLTTDVLPTLAPDVSLTLVPQNGDPTNVSASGGPVTFTATLTNNTNAAQSFQAWSNATLPNSNTFGPLVGPVTITLGAGGTLTRTLTQNVPSNAPAGMYSYNGYVGTFPGSPLDSDSFGVTKAGSLAGQDIARSADWSVVDVATGAAVVAGDRWSADAAPDAAVSTSVPGTFALSAAHPNPFDASTTLSVSVPGAARVTLTVFDVLGRTVATLVDGTLEAGTHSVRFDASHLPSGTYLVRMEAEGATGSFIQTQRMTRLR